MNSEQLKAFNLISKMIKSGDLDFENFFGGGSSVEKSPYTQLGEGFELRPIEIKNQAGKVIENRDKYSTLWRDGKEVTDLVFRKGGVGGDFKNGWCDLILYRKDPTKATGFDYGVWVLINRDGEVILESKKFSSNHPKYIGGIIGELDGYYYNLITKQKVAPTGSNRIITGSSIIIEHKYEWNDRELKLQVGVYSLSLDGSGLVKLD
jgi:hypothetical protein